MRGEARLSYWEAVLLHVEWEGGRASGRAIVVEGIDVPVLYNVFAPHTISTFTLLLLAVLYFYCIIFP
jgi:hypothetical protein